MANSRIALAASFDNTDKERSKMDAAVRGDLEVIFAGYESREISSVRNFFNDLNN